MAPKAQNSPDGHDAGGQAEVPAKLAAARTVAKFGFVLVNCALVVSGPAHHQP
jgi:hypothetical protein